MKYENRLEEGAGGYEEEQIRSTFEGRVGSRSRNSECVCVSESGWENMVGTPNLLPTPECTQW